MIATKPLADAADKWQRRAALAGPDYLTGIKNPRASWATQAQAANSNYTTAVTAAANAGRYAAGVKRVGDTKWSANAIAKGPSRFAEGVNLSVGNWSTGFSPYLDVIKNLTLPARGPTGSVSNLQRVQTVTEALRKLKTSKLV
jgi:hypothetical protein